jgi:hypothetical protein
MFGFGKISIPIRDLAQRLSQIALSPLTDPTGEDAAFRDQAVKLGMSRVGFALESVALQLFTVAACIKTRVLERGISNEQATELLEEYMVACEQRFLNQLPDPEVIELIHALLLPHTAFNVVLSRLDEYSKPEYAQAPNQSIPYLFAKLCGVPDPDEILMRIGWGIFIGRGIRYVDELKKAKLKRS